MSTEAGHKKKKKNTCIFFKIKYITLWEFLNPNYIDWFILFILGQRIQFTYEKNRHFVFSKYGTDLQMTLTVSVTLSNLLNIKTINLSLKDINDGYLDKRTFIKKTL